MMAGFGGFFGYSSTGIDWEKTMIGDVFGGNIKTVFGIVIILISFSSIVSVTSFREIPLPLMESDELLRPLTQAAVKQEVERKKNTVVIVQEVGHKFFFFLFKLTTFINTVLKPAHHKDNSTSLKPVQKRLYANFSFNCKILQPAHL